MPQDQIDLAMWYFAASNKLKNYGGYFNYKDHSVLKMICQAFGVSKSAAIIRLKELDYMEEHGKSISSGVKYPEHISFENNWQIALFGKDIAAFANIAHDGLHHDGRLAWLCRRLA